MSRNYIRITTVFFGLVSMFTLQNALASNQFLYFGVAPVYSSTYFGWQNVDTSSNTNPSANGSDVINGTNAETQIGIFIGYGVLLDKIYLGMEGGAQFGKRQDTSVTQDFNSLVPLNNTMTMSDIYLIDFRPGYVLGGKNSMLYGIIGLNTANFSAVQQTNDGIIVQDSGDIRRDGLRLGLGYNLGLGQHFMARVEYVFTKFSDFQFTDTYPNNTQTHTWELSPYSNEVSLGLSVVFNI